MLPTGEPVTENGRSDEEEGQKELDGQNGNQEEVADETEEVKTEELDEGKEEEEEEEEHRQNAGLGNNVNHQNSEQNDSGNQESEDGENDENQEENPSGLVVEEEEEEDDDEEEDKEEERRRIAVEKGKQAMPDQGGISITELNDNETDYHLDLAILRTISDYKCSTRDSPHPPSFNNLLLYIKNSFPDLKISREDLEEKIIALEKSFNDVRKQHGDDPEMAQPIDREIFNLSMLLWGRR